MKFILAFSQPKENSQKKALERCRKILKISDLSKQGLVQKDWEVKEKILSDIISHKNWGETKKEKWAETFTFYQLVEAWDFSILRNLSLAFLSLKMDQTQLGISHLRELYKSGPLKTNVSASPALLSPRRKSKLKKIIERFAFEVSKNIPENEQLLYRLYLEMFSNDLLSQKLKNFVNDFPSIRNQLEFVNSYNWGQRFPQLWYPHLLKTRPIQAPETFIEKSKSYLGPERFYDQSGWPSTELYNTPDSLEFLSQNLESKDFYISSTYSLFLQDPFLKKRLAARFPKYKRPYFAFLRERFLPLKYHPSLWVMAWIVLYDLGDYTKDDLDILTVKFQNRA